MPGTPIAKSHSFSSANCFTWRGVINCSASALRSSGRRGWCASASSSPSMRTVGGRPTLRCRSDPLRRIISCNTVLKLMPPGAGCSGADSLGTCVGLAIGIDLEEDLAVLDRLRVFDENLAHDTGVLRLDLVHDLHCFDDADDLTLGDTIADGDVCVRARLG